MEKLIYDGKDKFYNHAEFCRIVLAMPGSEVVLRDADKDWSKYHRYNVFCLEGVTILHKSILGRYKRDEYGHVFAEHVENIQVFLHGEELSVLYVEKKIKEAIAKFKEPKEKRNNLEKLVNSK